jgi:hypothetical protein
MTNTPKYYTSNGWNLNLSGGGGEYWLHNNVNGVYSFVARFKYRNAKASANHFVRFLTSDMTPAEYFEALATGKAPAQVLQARGYVSYNLARYG